MKALRFVRTIESGSLTLTDLETFVGKKVELIILPLEDEQDDWNQAGIASLNRAYGENEPEYTIGLVKERNPGYEAR